MDKDTETALRESIEHWKRVVKNPLGEETGIRACALCLMFFVNPKDYSCKGCPVHRVTRRPGCGGTPYQDFVNAKDDYLDGVSGVTVDVLRAAAQEELDFLVRACWEKRKGTRIMSKFVVGHINWFNYDLKLEIVEAKDEMEAIKKHSEVKDFDWTRQGEDEQVRPCETIEEMQQTAFDCDSMVNVIKIGDECA
jgi:hypothetical protein